MRPLWIACSHWLKTLALLLVLVNPIAAAEQSTKPVIPQPQGFVNDFAHALDRQSVTQLSALSNSLKQATGAEMVFVIMESIAPFDEFTYGMAIFDAWKIGEKDKNNGLLILLALKEHRIRISTGYGLEGILPDGKLGRYRDAYLIPFLKQDKIGAGLYNIGLVIAQDIAKDAGVALSGAAGNNKPVRGKKEESPLPWLVMLICIIIYVFIAGGRNRRRGIYGSAYYGGVYTRGGGGFGGGFSGFGGGFSGGGGVGGSW